MRAITYAGAAAVLAAAVLAGCGSAAVSTSAAGPASTAAVPAGPASTSAVEAGADPYLTEAVTLVQPCFTATKLVTAESCIEGKVPSATRAALKKCLADVPGIVGKPGASAAFRSGAETCTAVALR